MPLIKREFIYLRHGETDWNKDRIAMGQTDIDLNDKGIAQAHKAVEILGKYINEFDVIYSSPLKRTINTAKIVAKALDKEIITETNLMEINLGEKQGTSFLDSNWMEEWEEGAIFEGAENYDQFVARFIKGLNTALQDERRVLIISHGLAFIQMSKSFMDEELFLPNCVPVRCTPTDLGFTITELY